MRKVWTDEAWDDYLWWQQHDRKMLKRINQLIRDVERDPFNGIGKPEPLRGELSGMWSRRINQEDRLVYEVISEQLIIYSAKDHYS
ncbi:Txe/YoeB family addiction module toxin [uncultured Enorma sp.]|uniref:Txe/YoeB family addiction module toxin n=1 Tax=uncultured Enorma sp. TaxID=1714346 RepID=UPI002805A2E7|nr:Txe/YoeB family addiction module toxin [uncultured Enorma sp.]